MKKTFYTYQRLAGVALIPMGVGMFLYRDLLRAILLGDQWVDATEFLGIWGLLNSVSIIFCNFCSTYYRSKGKPKLSMIAQVIYLCVLIPALFFSVKVSFRALYYARSLATVFAIIQSFVIMRIVFKFKIHQTIFNVLPSIISALVMGAVAIGLQQLGSSLVWQIISVVICIVVYFGFLLLAFPKSSQEVLGMLKVKQITDRFLPKRK